MTRIELFIKEKNVPITKMENDLGLPNRSIQLNRGIPKKYVDVIEGYLEENYGYDYDNSLIEVDEPESKPESIKIWNKNFVPNYKDGIERFQSNDGLWRRYKDTVVSLNKETGEIKVTKGYERVNDKEYDGEFGSYWLCVNGTKVYKFSK
jgi:hypothetical protein